MRFDLLVLGEDIPAARLSEDENKNTKVSGLFVATTIATGVALLVLLYYKLLEEPQSSNTLENSQNEASSHEFKRKDKMLEVFKLISYLTDNKERYVDPTLIFHDRFENGWPKREEARIFRDSFYRSSRQVPRS
jgi:hypothetical protein